MASTIPKTVLVNILLLVSFVNFALTELSSEIHGSHVFGQRVPNDRLLYRVENPIGNEGFLTFEFAGPTEGPEITCVKIAVSDIFNQTMAYVASGGIGEKSIVVVVAVLHKTSFSYDASVYGI